MAVQNVVLGFAILESRGAGSVCGGIAAYGRCLLAGVGRIVKTVGLGLGFDVLKQHTRLNRQRAFAIVKRKYFVHALEREHDSALDGYGAAGFACPCAAHCNRDARVKAAFESRSNIFSCRCLYYSVRRVCLPAGQLVVAVVLTNVVCQIYALLPQEPFKPGQGLI